MSEQEIDTIIGEDIFFRGSVQFKKSLKINGRLKGTITAGGHLIIGESASVDADIEAGSVTIMGEMHGNISAQHRVELLRHSKTHGDIRTPDLHIQSGSRFTGSCIMD